jgi:hypothetical protein
MGNIEEVFVDLVVEGSHPAEVLSEAVEFPVEGVVLLIEFVDLVGQDNVLHRETLTFLMSRSRSSLSYLKIEMMQAVSDFVLLMYSYR